MTESSSPGKAILFGEHAVVYGQPAIAIPVTGVTARAVVENRPAGHGLVINALDLNLSIPLSTQADHGLALMTRLVLDYIQIPEPEVEITISSSIPIAGGLGSGAAVSAALGRALASHLGVTLSAQELSDLVYKTEQFYHGNASGIDNTVICYEKPVYFVKGKTPRVIIPARQFTLLIADTGVASPTKETVARVRASYERDSIQFGRLFDAIGKISYKGVSIIDAGYPANLGSLMTENHHLLQSLGVSSPELDKLVDAALYAGALGAKLSGGGGGGNMIALVNDLTAHSVHDALLREGAVAVLKTVVTG